MDSQNASVDQTPEKETDNLLMSFPLIAKNQLLKMQNSSIHNYDLWVWRGNINKRILPNKNTAIFSNNPNIYIKKLKAIKVTLQVSCL